MSRFFRHYFTSTPDDNAPHLILARRASYATAQAALRVSSAPVPQMEVEVEEDGEVKTVKVSDPDAIFQRVIDLVAVGAQGIGGDWSGVHPSLAPAPPWPSLDDPSGMDARRAVLRHLTVGELQGAADKIEPSLHLSLEEEGN